MLRELFYYLLGGLTFLPLCFFAGLIHFYLTCPSVQHEDRHDNQLPSDVELTQERKVAALDLAAANAALVSEIENSKGKDRPQGSSTAPSAARRLGPGPPATSGAKPHLYGPLVVRPRFEADATSAATSNAGAPASAPSNGDAASGAAVGAAARSAGGSDTDTDKRQPATSSYMSQMYKGLLDYRKIGTKKALPPADQKGASASAGQAGASGGSGGSTARPEPSLAGTTGKENFHCILKAPILYLYSSEDISDPNTECHAAIDLRGKRVSIFVSGLGDTMGEPDSDASDDDDDGDDGGDIGANLTAAQQKTKPQPGPLAAVKTAAAGAYDTQSSVDSDAEALTTPQNSNRSSSKRFAQAAWKRAKRAAVRDGELFMKRNAIRILGSWPTSGAKSRRPAPGQGRPQRPQWFVFCKSTTSMEDWYHALLQASFMPEGGSVADAEKAAAAVSASASSSSAAPSLRPGEDPLSPVFSKEDMASLLVSLDSLPDPIPLRWLNAMVGRIFYSVYRTAWLEDYITRKMMKKISRVKTPGFLGDIKVQEVDVGRRAPGFSRPMLKSLTSDGEASMEVACHYVGEVRITISTSVTISLGSRFKPYTISLVLAVVLRSLEGNLLLQVKPPPSNRLWFGFTTLPKMEIDVEPVVSERKVQWGMVTRLIEGRIRELLTESIVVPNMDDVPFFDTRSLPYRGAIFADAAKRADDSLSTAAVNSETAKANAAKEIGEAASAAKKVNQSAPVSGTATPVSAEPKAADVASEGESTATAERADAANLRNRKSSSLKPVGDAAQQQQRMASSPAAAGLSDLLSRDLAAGGSLSSDKLSSSPSRSDTRLSMQSQPSHSQQQQSNRKSWFGGSTASRMSSTSSTSSGLSLPSAPKTKGGRGREQSSLAWGNASLSHVPGRTLPQQASPKSAPMQDLVDLEPTHSRSVERVEPARVDAVPQHRNNKSISSISSSVLGTEESGVSATTDELNASIEAAARTSGHDVEGDSATLALPGEDADPADPVDTPTSDTLPVSSPAMAKTPSLMVSKASEDDMVGLQDPAATRGSSVASSSVHHGADRSGDQSPTVDSPSSYGGTSSLGHRSSSSTPAAVKASDEPGAAQSKADSTSLSSSLGASDRRTSSGDGYEGDPITRASSSPAPSGASSSRSSTHGFAPPPRRSAQAPPARRGNDVRAAEVPSSHGSGLSASHQSRYGLGAENAHSSSADDGQAPSTTTALLLNSWTKAKASMADKESRQAAAKDAKDAIKRGWASWNQKRNEKAANSGTAQDGASISSSSSSFRSGLLASSVNNSSRFSLSSATSSWLGTSPPMDPTSLGTGLEGDSSQSRPAKAGGASVDASLRSEAERRARVRQGLQDDNDDSGSAKSSSSGRTPYRELRASKAAHSQVGAQQQRMHDLRDYDSRTESEGEGESATSAAQWSADVPSLAAPAPTLQRKTSENSQASGKGPSRSKVDYPATGDSPSANAGSPLRRRVSSTASNGVGGGVSFMPPAPTTTTSLASTSSLYSSSLSPIGGSSPADGNSPLPTPPAAARKSDIETDKTRRSAAPLAQAEKQPEATGAARVRPSSSGSSPSITRTGGSGGAGSTTALSPQMHASPRLYSPEGPSADAMASPSSSSNMAKVQTQPSRAAMMAVPGIPSMQKSIPQSFSAPPPSEVAPAQAPSGSPTALRMGSMFRMPAFGSKSGSAVPPPDVGAEKSGATVEPVGAGVPAATNGATAADTGSAEVPHAGTTDLPSPSGAGHNDGATAGGLGLLNLDPLPPSGEAAVSAEPVDAADSARPPTLDDSITDPISSSTSTAAAAAMPPSAVDNDTTSAAAVASRPRDGDATPSNVGGEASAVEDETFATVAKAEGPAVDGAFAESLLDVDRGVQVGMGEGERAMAQQQQPQPQPVGDDD